MASTQPRANQSDDMGAFASLFLATDIVRLFQAPTVVGPLTKLSDLTEATFVGYAGVPLTGLVVVNGLDPLGNGIAKITPQVSFTAGVILATETEGGWYITDAAGGDLKALANFGIPVTFASTGDELLMNPFIIALFTGDADSEFVAGA